MGRNESTRLELEALEQRLLLSGEGALLGVDAQRGDISRGISHSDDSSAIHAVAGFDPVRTDLDRFTEVESESTTGGLFGGMVAEELTDLSAARIDPAADAAVLEVAAPGAAEPGAIASSEGAADPAADLAAATTDVQVQARAQALAQDVAGDAASGSVLDTVPAGVVEASRAGDLAAQLVETLRAAQGPPEGVNLLVIDRGVAGAEALAAAALDGFTVYTLDTEVDGVLALARILSEHQGVRSLHVLSHGSDGRVELGSTTLSRSNLFAYQDVVRGWGTAFAPGADLYLYGCDVASTEAGREFVVGLAALTRADVAVSADRTGAATLGGDWDLEVRVGDLNAATPFRAAALAGFNGLLQANPNEAPTVMASLQLVSTNEDESVVFSTANQNLISVSDADAGAGELKTTLDVGFGTLTLATTSGLTFTTGDGTADPVLVFTATVAATNAALDGMTYTPALNYNYTLQGLEVLLIEVDDQGNTGDGGAQAGFGEITINVTPVNDAPTNTVPAVQNTNEDVPLVFSAGNSNAISVADVDSNYINVKLAVTAGTLSLTGPTQTLNFLGGTSEVDDNMEFEGMLNDINAALSALTFTPPTDYSGTVTLTLTTNDVSQLARPVSKQAAGHKAAGKMAVGGPDQVTINVLSVNDAPTVEGPAGPLSVGEDGSYFLTFQLADSDAGAGLLKVTLGATNGILTLGDPQVVQFLDGGNGQSAMVFEGDLTSLNQALQLVAFQPTPDLSGVTAQVTLVLNDQSNTGSGGALEDTHSVQFDILPSNDAPVNSFPGAQSTVEDGELVFGSAHGNAITVTDVDGANPDWLVTLAVTHGVLTLSGTNGLQFPSEGQGSGDALIVMTGSLASINAALEGMFFTPDPDYFGPASLTITSDDQIEPPPVASIQRLSRGGLHVEDSDNVSITINPAPDMPSATGASTNEDLQTTAGLVLTRNPVDSTEVSHFQITTIQGGTLYLNDGVTEVAQGTFITVAQGELGLKFTPTADFNGTGTIGFFAAIGATTDNLSVEGADADIVVTAVNDAPTLTPGSNITVLEDAVGQVLTDWASGLSSGPANESTQTTTISVTTDNVGLFQVQPSLDAAGTLVFTPAANEYGLATLTITVQDNGGTANGGVDSFQVTRTITVQSVNDAPSFQPGPDQNVNAGAALVTVSGWAEGISAGPLNEESETASFVVTNSNNALFDTQPAIDGTGTLTYKPAAAAGGSVTVTVRLQDDGGTANGGVDFVELTFTINVLAVNQAPVFVKGLDQTLLEDAAAVTVAGWATGIGPGHASEAGQTLTFAVTNNNNALFSVQPAVSATGTLTYTLAANRNGSATITVTLQDNGGTANGGADTSAPQQFQISVTAVNDAPSFVLEANPSVLEDSAAGSIASFLTGFSAGPFDESVQSVALAVSNDNPGLFSVAPAIDGAGVLTWTLAANAFGSATVTVTATDDGGTTNSGDADTTQTFTLTVASVNDAPTFLAGSGDTVLEDSGARTISNWATAITSGPGNESSQNLSFEVTTNNSGLFSVQPAVNQAGTLSYTPAPNAFGSATLTIRLLDDGGTANGGSDASAPAQITVTVTGVQDPPIFTSSPGTTGNANEAYTYNVTVSDPDAGDTLTLTGVTIPSWLTFNVSLNQNLVPVGTLSGTPTDSDGGVHSVLLRVTDGNTTVDQTFDVTITAAIANVVFNVGTYLRVTASSIVPIASPPAGTPFATAGSALIEFLLLPDFASITATNVPLYKDGASIDGFELSTLNLPTSGAIGSGLSQFLSLGGVTFTPSFIYRNATPSGTLGFTATGGTLFPSGTGFNAVLEDSGNGGSALTFSIHITTGALNFTVEKLRLSIGTSVNVVATGTTLAYTPGGAANQTIATIANVTLDFVSAGVTATIDQLQVRQDGFSVTTVEVNVGSPAIGSLFTLTNGRVGATNFGYTSGGPLQGSLYLKAGSASLNVGTEFTGAITDGPDGDSDAIVATFNLVTKVFSFSLDQVTLSVPGVFSAQTSGLVVTYDPSGPATQTLVTLATLGVTLDGLSGASVALTNLVIRQNGFSIDNASVTTADLSLGGFGTLTAPTITLSGVSYTTGGQIQGSLSITANSASVGFAGSLSTTITDGGDADNLAISGAFDLVTKSLSFTVDQAALTVPGVLTANAAGFAIQFNPSGAADQVVVTLLSLTVQLLPLGVSVSVSELRIRRNGFEIANATVAVASNPTIAGVLTLTAPSLTFANISYTSGGSLQGTITLGVAAATVSVGGVLTGTISDGADADTLGLSGSFNLATTAFSLTFDQLSLTIPGVFSGSTAGTTFTYDPDGPGARVVPHGVGKHAPGGQELIAIGSFSATLPAFGGVAVTLTDLRIRNNGFSLGNATATLVTSPTIGGVFTINTPTLSFTGISYTFGGSLQGTIGLSAAGATLAVGTGITFTISDGLDVDTNAVAGSFNVATTAFSVTLDQLALTVPGVLTASATGVVFSYDPDGAPNQEVFALASLNATILPLNNTTVAVSNLRVRANGFSLDNATVTLPDVPIAGILTLTAPSVTFTNFSYTTGGSLQGSITLGVAAATVSVGGVMTGSISDGPDADAFGVSGSFDLATTAFSLTLDQLSLTIPGVFSGSTAGTTFTYDPDGPGARVAPHAVGKHSPGGQELIAIGSFSATLPAFGGVAVTLTDLRIRNNGFSLGNATATLVTSPTIGGVLTINTPSLSFTGISYTFGGSLQGTIGLSAAGATLAVGTGITFAISDGADADTHAVAGSFNVATTAFSVTLDQLALTIPGVLTANATGVVFGYDPDGAPNQEVFAIASLNATILPLNSTTVAVSNLRVRANGFSLDNATVTLPDVPIAGILTLTAPSVTFTNFSYTTGGSLQGTITLGVAAATVSVGGVMTGAISDGPDADTFGVSGSFDLATTAFSLTLDQLSLTIPGVFSGSTSGTTFTYDPDGPGARVAPHGVGKHSPGGQELIAIGSFSATLPAFGGVAVTLTDLRIRNNGFSLGNGTATLVTSPTIGGVLTITTPSLSFSGISYTFGGSLQGTIGLTAAGATLAVGTGITFAISDGADGDTNAVAGSFNVATTAFSVTLDQLALTIPGVLTASATGVVFGYDPDGAPNQEVFAIASLNATILSLNNTTVAVSNLRVRANGFSLDNATVTLPDVPIAGILTLTAPSVTFTNFSYTTGGSLQGTITLGVAAATVSVGGVMTGAISDGPDADAFGVSGSFDLGTTAFSLTLDQLSLTIPGVFSGSTSGTTFTYDPDGPGARVAPHGVGKHSPGGQELIAIGSFSATLPAFGGVAVTLNDLRIRNNGFSLGSGTATLVTSPTIGGVLTITTPSLSFTGISYTFGGSLQGTIGLTAAGATLAVGTGITFAISDGADADTHAVAGSFNVATTAFSVTLDQLALTVPGVLTASASGVVFGYDPDGAPNQEVFAIGSLNATILPLNNTTVALSNLRVRANGFSLDNATVTLPDVPIAGILTLTAPSVTFTNFSYTTGGSLQGTITLGVTAATVSVGGVLTGSISDGPDADTFGVSGSFDLATTAFSLTLDQLSLTIPGVFSGSTAGTTFTYDPDGPGARVAPHGVGKHSPGGQELMSIGSFSATLIPFGNAAVTLTDLRIRNNGFSLGNGTITLPGNHTIGGVLTINAPSLSFTGVSYTFGGSLQGTIGVAAAGATLAIGSGITFTISDGSDGDTNAVAGSFNVATTAFSVTLDQLALTIPGLLTANASGVVFGYDPDGAPDQEVFAIATLSATIQPISTTANVVDLRVRTNGFSLGAGNIVLPTLSVGGFLTVTSPTIQFQSASYTVGGTLQGTIGISASSATLFAGRDFTAAITDGADADTFGISGGYNLSTSAFALAVDQLNLSVPNVFNATGAGITIGYDPTGPASQTLFSLTSGQISFPRFGLTGALSNLVVRGDGFQFGQLTVSSSQTLSMGSILQLTGLGVTISNFGVTYGAGVTFNGSIALTAAGAAFFPGSSVFTSTLTNVTAEFLFTGGALGALRFTVGTLQINVAGKISISASNVSITPDDFVVLNVNSATASLPSLGISGTVTGLEVTSSGEVSVVSVSVNTQGFAASFGLGNLLPFEITGLGIGFLGDTNGNGQRDSGEVFRLDEFDLTVTGFFNFSKLGSLPFTPIIRIGPQGSQSVATSSAQRFTFTVTIENGTVRPKNIGPIEIGFSDLRIGQTVVLGGTVILGGYQNGQWVNSFGGSLSLQASPAMSNISGGASVTILGSFNPNTGALDVTGTLTVSFTLQGKINVVNIGLGFAMSLRTDSNFNVQVQSLALTSASFERVELTFGSVLKLTATGGSFDFNPAPGGNIASFTSLSVQLTGLGIGGTARNFAISDSGGIRALPGFGVSLNASPGALRWPSWLPIQITELGLTWRDFNADPLDFRIILSASVTGLQGLPVNVSGSVSGLVIDVGLLRDGKFPIVELGSASISISGNLFGGEVNGAIFLGIMRTDAGGNLIPAGNTETPVANRVLYGGIIAGFSVAGLAGFEIRIGVSELGPLSVFVQAGIPILIEPNSGLTISNFRAGVTFNTSLPSITNPLDLRGAAFQPTGDLTAQQWQAQLEGAVLNQIRSGQTDFWQAFTQPMKIEGGATLYTSYTSQNVFRAEIDLIISTDGKIMINGRFVFGNTISMRGVMYADLSQLLSGSGTFLFLMDVPAEAPILTIRGALTFGFTRNDGTTVTATNQADNFELRISGGVDLSALGLASLTIEGSVNVKFSPMPLPNRVDIDLSGEFYATLLGQRISLAGAAGVVRLDLTTNVPKIWGALAITSNLQFLERIGIFANVSTIFRLNITDSDRQETLNIPGRGNVTVDLKAFSYSFLLEGFFVFRKDGADWFRMQGLYGMEISANDGLSLFAQGRLSIGPPALNFLQFDFNGFLQLSSRGIAGMIDLTLAAQLPANYGLSFNASFHLLLNTTMQQVTYTLPPSIVEVPGGGFNRTIVIPPKPLGSAPGSPNAPYLQIKGTGSLTALAFQINGEFSLLVSPVAINLQVSGSMSLVVGSTTFFRFTVAGGFNIDSTGAAAALDLALNTGLPANLGFTLSATFRLEFNTSNRAQTIAGINLAAGVYAKVRATGYLQVAGLRMDGYFEITVGPTRLNFQAAATLDLRVGATLLASFNVGGGFQVDTTGIAAAFALTVRTGLPTNRGYSFSLTFRLEINTTNRAQNLGGVSLEAGSYARISGQGTLTIGGLNIAGSFLFSIGASGINVQATATLDLRVGSTTLFGFNVAGGFIIDASGMVAAFSLSLRAGLPSNVGFSFNVTFRLEVNTTGTARTVAGITVTANTVRIFASGFLQIAGAFRFDGSFSLTIAPDRVVIRVAASMNLFGATVSVGGDFGLFSDGLAASFTLSFGGINTSFFALTGTFALKINTTNRNIFSVPGRTFLVSVTNARLTILGVSLTGSISIGIVGGVFRMDIPSSSPLTVSLGNFFTVSVFGFVSGNGTFSLTGTANVNLGRNDLVGISGTLTVTIANSGFSARLNGSVYMFNTQVASAGGNLSISANDFNLSVWINFNFSIFGVLTISGGGTLNISRAGLVINFTANARLFNSINASLSAGINTITGRYYFGGSTSIYIGNSNLGVSASLSIRVANFTGYGGSLYFNNGFSVSLSGSAWARFKIAGYWVGPSAHLSASFSTSGTFSVRVNACISLAFWTPCAGVTVNVDLRNGFRIWLSDISDAEVFLDANKNGARDDGEPLTVSDADGNFSFTEDAAEVVDPTSTPLGSLVRYDINRNGQLDAEEGRFVIRGGTVLETGAPLQQDVILEGTHVVGSSLARDATIFFDSNLNGQLDSTEVSTKSLEDGSFSFLQSTAEAQLGLLARFDKNGNGVLDEDEGRLRVQGGTMIDTATGQVVAGDQDLDNAFLAGLSPATNPERIYFDANFNSTFDSDEVAVKPDANGFYTFLDLASVEISNLGRLKPFDKNGNGFIDDTEGEFVISGGTDKNTGLPNTQVIRMPASDYGRSVQVTANPLTEVFSALRRSGLSEDDSHTAVQVGFGLPSHIQVDIFDPRKSEIDDFNYVPFVLRGTEKMNVLLFGGAPLLGGSSQTAQRAIVDEVAATLKAIPTPEFVIGPDNFPVFPESLKLSDVTVVRKLLAGAAARLNLSISADRLDAAATVIAGLNRRIDATVAASPTGDLITALADVKALAQTGAASAIREMVAGSKTPAQVAADFSDAAIAQKLGQQELPPYIGRIDNRGSDGSAVRIPVRIENPNGAPEAVSLTVAADNLSLLPAGSIVVTGSGLDRSIEITPRAGFSGSAQVRLTAQVKASDGRILTSVEDFMLTVSTANAGPVIAPVSDQVVAANGATSPIRIEITDRDVTAQELSVVVVSENEALLPATGIQLSGTGASRTLVLTPARDQSGPVGVVIEASDGVSTSTLRFLLVVLERNDGPSVTVVIDPAVADPNGGAGAVRLPEGARVHVFDLVLSDRELGADALQISIRTDNANLFDVDAFLVSGVGERRSVTVAPRPGAFGVATVTITVSDGTASTTRTVGMAVTGQNDRPVFNGIQDQVIADGQTARMTFQLTDDGAGAGSLILTVKSSDPILLPASSLKLSGTGSERTLEIAPIAGVLGVATVTLTATDGEFTTITEFLVAVDGPNSAPRATRIAPSLTIPLNGQSSLITFSVFDRETAPGDLKIEVTASNENLIQSRGLVVGGFGAERTLLIAPEGGQAGTSSVTVTVSDGERSSSQTFQVLVEKLDLTITSWQSVAVHGAGLGALALDVPDSGLFSEPRLGGFQELWVHFSTVIDPNSLISERVGVTGLDANNRRMDLSGITWTTTTLNDGRTGVIRFSQSLPDLARYRVALSDVKTVGGTALTGDRDRLITALQGDVDGDQRITRADAALVRGARSAAGVDARALSQIRSDLNLDGRVSNIDLGGVIRLAAVDLRFIGVPSFPGNVLPPLPGEVIAKDGFGSRLPSPQPIALLGNDSTRHGLSSDLTEDDSSPGLPGALASGILPTVGGLR